MKSRSRTAFALSCVMIAMALAVLIGCSQTPTQPTASEPRLLTRASFGASGAALAPVDLYTEAVIPSRSGGTLSLLDVILTVPAGAVKNDTLFSISVPDDELFYNEFGTSGLVFDVPVTVTMSYRNADLSGITESHIKLAWLDERTNTWRSMACVVDTVSKTVTGNLYHFSAYGLISD
jgi:hypothetical protein